MNEFQELLNKRLERIQESKLPNHVKEVVRKITYCRTNAMPGRLYSCPQGHFSIFLRESCNSRSCPTCQRTAKEEWRNKTKDLILKVPHYHIVFKIPSFCYPYITMYYKQFIDVLFNTSNQAIHTILKYSQYKKSIPGFISVLHTHGDELQLHPHLHMILSSVAFDRKRKSIVRVDDNFFDLNEFQEIYSNLLKKELIKLYNKNPEIGELFLKQVKNLKDQRIFLSERYETGNHIIEYLSKTLKGSGINLNELEKENEKILIKKKQSISKLEEEEFVRRFILHILPAYTKSVRYMGLYSSGSRTTLEEVRSKLCEEIFRQCDEIILEKRDNILPENNEEMELHKYCPFCKSRMILIEEVDPYHAPSILRIKFGKDPPLEELFTRLTA